MTISVNFHDASAAERMILREHGNDVLRFKEGSNWITLFVPPHVAEHTAAAFNRAMQAVPDRGAIEESWTYTTKSGAWNIRRPMPLLYTAQHDEVTGDNDPAWMFAEGSNLIELMDLIDDIEAEEMDDAKTDADITRERALA